MATACFKSLLRPSVFFNGMPSSLQEEVKSSSSHPVLIRGFLSFSPTIILIENVISEDNF